MNKWWENLAIILIVFSLAFMMIGLPIYSLIIQHQATKFCSSNNFTSGQYLDEFGKEYKCYNTCFDDAHGYNACDIKYFKR